MKTWAVPYLACPATGSPLDLRVEKCEGDEVLSGVLISREGREYGIERGIASLGLEFQNRKERSTVTSFGKQWKTFNKCDGFMGSDDLFFSFLPDLSRDSFKEKVVLEAGCGNGRWLTQLAEMGPQKVIGFDYSESVETSWENTRHLPNVTVVQGSILEPPFQSNVFDVVVTIGVLHHLSDPKRGLAALKDLIKHDVGQLAAWVYGHEGNEMYLRLAKPLRTITPHLPMPLLMMLSRILAIPVWCHSKTINRWFGVKSDGSSRLPMGEYIELLSKISLRDLTGVVYDQLSPQLAQYYRKDQVLELIDSAGLELSRLSTPRDNSYSFLTKNPCGRAEKSAA